ncbi:ATP-dependent nuclease [Asticcacaulis sp. 201]|uniref:ATP-dependent nuclease n=1 Tax=Asticcacaulis sp. 201 TaxID=3028787 RepID=UPI002915D4A2|nr:AAA family ATPase [Asticcacaulis sp. 201]MDV6333141.1 AAA family ATPase [Asticcacaulis sp. 201]
MRLIQAKISNFRSVKNITVEFAAHTAFVGGNGAGKSSILRAIDKFYSTTKTLEVDDYYGRDTTQPVEIELTFSSLTPEETAAFESRVRDGRLTVTRVFDGSASSGRYHGAILQDPTFRPIREAVAFNAKRDLYNALREGGGAFGDLPGIRSAANLDEALADYEAHHPEDLVLMRDDGQFFGFQNASRGALQRYTYFVFVPAVRDAALDAADSKSSAIQQLLEIVVRSAILQRPDLLAFRAEMNTRYQELTAPENMPELSQLGEHLTADLKQLYENAEVGLAWRALAEMPIPLPAADVSLTHDGFGGPVDRQGHGLQRAFIFTLLQHLARNTRPPQVSLDGAAGESAVPPVVPAAPSLILAVEEPELYQHPTKQRHLASVLRKLSAGTLPGAGGPTQILFASHSPLFVSMPHVDEIRFTRRVDCDDGEFRMCEVKALDLSAVASQLETAAGKEAGTFTADSLKARLHILGPELSEGFFADAVVLVEGRSDKAALVAAADRLGVNFEAAGIAVLSAEGKTCIDRPLLIFREIGIPTYPIWDCDIGTRDYKPEQNLLLIRAAAPDEENPEIPVETHVADGYACFRVKLEETLKSEITPAIYEACLDSVSEEFGAGRGDAQKNPEIMKILLARADEQGGVSQTLERIVRQIWQTLRNEELPQT